MVSTDVNHAALKFVIITLLQLAWPALYASLPRELALALALCEHIGIPDLHV